MTEAPQEEKAQVSADHLHMHKGEEVILNKIAPSMNKVLIGLGWDAPEEVEGNAVDIDASAFLLNRDGFVRSDTDFIFYNNLTSENDSIRHCGDNTTGSEEGDDEMIRIDLNNLPFDVEKIAFSVTIHNAEERQQTFGLIKGAYIRIVSEDDGSEIAHFDLSEDASEDNAMIFGELVREGMGWKFKALGTTGTGGLFRIARDFRVNVAPA
jgi:tellurium resistance protein TerD